MRIHRRCRQYAYRSSSLPFAPVRSPFAVPSFSSSSSTSFSSFSSSTSTVYVSLYRSWCPPRVLPSLFSARLLLLLFILLVSHSDLSARGAPSDVPGFLRRYRESFRVRLRATDYRNQATPGSGISNANYNHRFCSYVTSLFSCDDRAQASAHVRLYVRLYVCMFDSPADVPNAGPCRFPRTRVGKTCHSAAYTRDLWRFTVTEARYVAKLRALDKSRSVANHANAGELDKSENANLRRLKEGTFRILHMGRGTISFG